MSIEHGEITHGVTPETQLATDLQHLTSRWLKEGHSRDEAIGALLGYGVLALVEADGGAATAARLVALADRITGGAA
ncbi:MAG: hypothetical protein DSZ00_08760 [Gammaproteobacteria bacterium]|nr:MAG: hypothetical protein DSZ00_08760 [Gammaproteobacteria bacterium]RTZ75563.1 MAG: hypothetical protein DSZ02_03070 [Gammaproteobacteria bacterium]